MTNSREGEEDNFENYRRPEETIPLRKQTSVENNNKKGKETTSNNSPIKYGRDTTGG